MKTKVKEMLKAKGHEVFSIATTGKLKDAVGMFNAKHIGALMVLGEDEGIQGIVTERDIMIKLAQTEGEIKDMSVKIVMTPKEKLIVGTPEDTIEYLMKVMTSNRIRHIPIVNPEDRSKLAGMVSIGDVVKALLHDMDHENKLLRDYIEGTYPV